ncbi:hypothetical protein ACFLQI_00675 [Candidatus Undinarchaeota archaeon]
MANEDMQRILHSEICGVLREAYSKPLVLQKNPELDRAHTIHKDDVLHRDYKQVVEDTRGQKRAEEVVQIKLPECYPNLSDITIMSSATTALAVVNPEKKYVLRRFKVLFRKRNRLRAIAEIAKSLKAFAPGESLVVIPRKEILNNYRSLDKGKGNRASLKENTSLAEIYITPHQCKDKYRRMRAATIAAGMWLFYNIILTRFDALKDLISEAEGDDKKKLKYFANLSREDVAFSFPFEDTLTIAFMILMHFGLWHYVAYLEGRTKEVEYAVTKRTKKMLYLMGFHEHEVKFNLTKYRKYVKHEKKGTNGIGQRDKELDAIFQSICREVYEIAHVLDTVLEYLEEKGLEGAGNVLRLEKQGKQADEHQKKAAMKSLERESREAQEVFRMCRELVKLMHQIEDLRKELMKRGDKRFPELISKLDKYVSHQDYYTENLALRNIEWYTQQFASLKQIASTGNKVPVGHLKHLLGELERIKHHVIHFVHSEMGISPEKHIIQKEPPAYPTTSALPQAAE